jgi:hypothetical protein
MDIFTMAQDLAPMQLIELTQRLAELRQQLHIDETDGGNEISFSLDESSSDDDESDVASVDSDDREAYRRYLGGDDDNEGLTLHPPIDVDIGSHCAPLDYLPGIAQPEPHFFCDCTAEGMGLPECCQDDRYQFLVDRGVEISDRHLESARDTVNNPLREENNLRRKRLYKQLYHAVEFGIYDHDHSRRPLPTCAVARIRQIYPSETGQYMGFKDA